MSFIVLSSGTLAEFMPDEEKNAEALSIFVAFQSLLFYFVAGVAKSLSPSWRDGTAVEGIFRTQTYGDEGLYRFLRKRKWRAKTMSRAVTAAEVPYPMIVVLPKSIRSVGLGIGAAFHVANVRYMGLNRFF